MLIGREHIYGLFEKQLIVPQQGVYQYQLRWQAGSATSLLVVSSGAILEPLVDYNLVIDGRSIIFVNVPSAGTYVVFLGRELSVARTIGIEPKLDRFVGTGQQQSFTVSVGPVNADAVIVFVDGVQKKNVDDFSVNGNNIVFVQAPALNADISVYIHGVERFDPFVLTDGCITTNYLHDGAVNTQKILNNSVTGEKLNLLWTNYVPVIETFNGMTIASQVIHKAQYRRFADSIQIKLDFECQFSGVVDNRVRYSAPFGEFVDEITPASINLSTNALIDNGVQTWGSDHAFDIQRPGGINYTLNTVWRFKIRAEYDIV